MYKKILVVFFVFFLVVSVFAEDNLSISFLGYSRTGRMIKDKKYGTTCVEYKVDFAYKCPPKEIGKVWIQYCQANGSTGDSAAPDQYVQNEKGVVSFLIGVVPNNWARVCATISVGSDANRRFASSGPIIVSDKK